MNDTIVILDCNYIGHQARYATGNLSHDDVATGVVFGFLSRVLSLARFLRSNRLVFCWDSRHSYRKKLFPEYKANRHQNLDEEQLEELETTLAQFRLLRLKILPTIGFKNVFMQPGLEADDLIAIITYEMLGDFVVVSADEDLFQLLRNMCTRIFNPSKKKFMTHKKFVEEYGIGPHQWATAKSYAGCPTDNIPGVKGVGVPTAIKFLCSELNNDSKKHIACQNMDGKLRQRNWDLMHLPHPKTKPVQLQHDEFSMEGFKRVCKKHGMESFLREDRLEEWQDLFNGKMDTKKKSPVKMRRRK